MAPLRTSRQASNGREGTPRGDRRRVLRLFITAALLPIACSSRRDCGPGALTAEPRSSSVVVTAEVYGEATNAITRCVQTIRRASPPGVARVRWMGPTEPAIGGYVDTPCMRASRLGDSPVPGGALNSSAARP